jgi:ankyrin repeat protein
MNFDENQQNPLSNRLRAGLARAIFCLFLLAIGVMWHFAEPDDPQTMLLSSSQNGDVRHIERALSRGAAIDAQGSGGLTPLILAARGNHRAAVEYLLQHHANVNACSDVYGTALILAAQNGQIEMVKQLLAAGADVNAVTKLRCTALWSCATSGDPISAEVAHIVIDAGADPHRTNLAGQSALDVATRARDSAMVKLLQARERETALPRPRRPS